jgi:MICOS complex subunit MIC10
MQSEIDKSNAPLLSFAGGGLLIGSVLSLVVFKRRSWPILMGGGFGIGVAYTNCEKSLNGN